MKRKTICIIFYGHEETKRIKCKYYMNKSGEADTVCNFATSDVCRRIGYIGVSCIARCIGKRFVVNVSESRD